MSRPRHLVGCLIVLGLLALVTPAASPAACGGSGSAGDQQYVDPLAHCRHAGSSSGSSSPAPSTPSPPVTAAATTSTTPTTSTSPTATTATPAATTKAGKALPYTGLDTRLIVGLGLALVLSGVGLRRATRDRRRGFRIR